MSTFRSGRTLASEPSRAAVAASPILRIAGLAVLSLLISLMSGAAAWAQSTTRVSVPNSGFQANGNSSLPSAPAGAISSDGRFVVFQSVATNLVANDGNAQQDIFVRDRTNGTTARVSVPDSGFEANGASKNPAISADGRFVAFASDATNLVANDRNVRSDIFVRDMTNGRTTRVSVTDTGGEANLGSSTVPAISADGRFVAFTSAATNLVANDGNGVNDVFVRDRTNGRTTRVSVPDSGFEANGTSFAPAISADGQLVAFASTATNLVANDGNGQQDVFVRDRTNGRTTRVSVPDSGFEANGGSVVPAISADGRFVVFGSSASNLVANDGNNSTDVFVRDRLNARTTRVSVPDSGFEGNHGGSTPTVSADGRFVAFRSSSTNLVANDGNGVGDVFVRDRTNGRTTRVSVPDSGFEANGVSLFAAISGDSRFVAFQSDATNLVANDSNAAADVFVRDRGAFGPKTLVTLSLAKKRIPARGPLRVRVRNRNHFPIIGRLSGKTVNRVSVAAKRRVRLKAKAFSVGARAKKTVRLRLPKALRRELARTHKLRLRLTAKVEGPAGRTRIVTKRVTPRLKTRRRR